MPEVIVCTSVVRAKLLACYRTVRLHSLPLTSFKDLVDLDIRQPIKKAPITQVQATVLMNYLAGMYDGLVHTISEDLCEVVCKGADGAIHKGANSAGTGLRWKGTDFLFTAIEVQS